MGLMMRTRLWQANAKNDEPEESGGGGRRYRGTSLQREHERGWLPPPEMLCEVFAVFTIHQNLLGVGVRAVARNARLGMRR